MFDFIIDNATVVCYNLFTKGMCENINQGKMILLNKVFNNDTIITVWNKEQEKYFISVVDIVGIVSESDRPRKYLSDLKNKLKEEGNEVSEKIGQLKLKASDGKYYNTYIDENKLIDTK